MQTEIERHLATAFDRDTSQDDAIRSFLLARQIVTSQGSYDPATMPSMCGVHVLPFGKYKGRLVDDVAATDLPYLRWFSQTVTNKPDLTRYIDSIIQKGLQL